MNPYIDCLEQTNCLNPFENQVYFYTVNCTDYISGLSLCLNPFENQVYFYIFDVFLVRECLRTVLIPLRIRSISTAEDTGLIVSALTASLNPFENQVYFYSWKRWKQRSVKPRS